MCVAVSIEQVVASQEHQVNNAGPAIESENNSTQEYALSARRLQRIFRKNR